MFLLKLLFRPVGIVFGLASGLVARRLFKAAWSLVDDEQPPKPITHRTSWPKVLGATALQAAIFSTTKAAADRMSAQTFHYLFGAWPGPERPEPAEEDPGRR